MSRVFSRSIWFVLQIHRFKSMFKFVLLLLLQCTRVKHFFYTLLDLKLCLVSMLQTNDLQTKWENFLRIFYRRQSYQFIQLLTISSIACNTSPLHLCNTFSMSVRLLYGNTRLSTSTADRPAAELTPPAAAAALVSRKLEKFGQLDGNRERSDSDGEPGSFRLGSDRFSGAASLLLSLLSI